MSNPELSAKSIGLVIANKADVALFYSLPIRQRGYVLHWLRSNLNRDTSIQQIVKKAKAQRP